ncbi:Tyrosine-protein kinase [Trema orientale]|uniref:Tyrosine-protein kinase n=1 Tax=Trema orientale TaxID=63057 RepID=A0A2P5EUV3_TREOI|nr:Tyrosine-protein kinase [Trema orientale]
MLLWSVFATCGFMAVEVSEDKRCTEKSGVFSFGVILVEVLMGKRTNGYLSLIDRSSSNDLRGSV